MSSKTINKKIRDDSDQQFKLRSIPYLLYEGNEKIPFKERHPVYQAILLGEFPYKVRKVSNKKSILKKRFFTHLSF